MGYLAVLSTTPPKDSLFLPHMIGGICAEDTACIRHGSIASVSGTGEVLILWESGSQQNSLLLTEACNCRCVMCPQPPNKHDPALFATATRVLDLLKGKPLENICITGGEPTLFADNFINILRRCHAEHPGAQVSILTNAKKCSDGEFIKKLSTLPRGNDTFCVSLHSDIPEIHDEIVGAKGSYDETQAGIYSLAQYRFPIEIRHVVMKQNYSRLKEFSEYLYRYFPFCAHYAFMSMEIHGVADVNATSVYIDPADYQQNLRSAILALSKRGLHVSVYNTPLCLCHKDIRAFSRQSISSWKNTFLEQCDGCEEKESCCGFFSTSALQSNHISPIMSQC
ncbi:MAG: His-Xaa-Ser system radical SAM maturase HxsC [Desulfovibrio sp.]|jgi:His-Xaa-Ser system radical SAM maturase HxsC|nr:His-Xaa-Ser system radical SAM maturase HxsC [Desulfovibrio sp.]